MMSNLFSVLVFTISFGSGASAAKISKLNCPDLFSAPAPRGHLIVESTGSLVVVKTEVPLAPPTMTEKVIIKGGDKQFQRVTIIPNKAPSSRDTEAAIDLILSNPEKAREIADRYGRGESLDGSDASASGVRLEERGDNRYFWFKPNGLSEYVPARVQHIHQVQDGKLYLVEYIPPGEKSSLRQRVVQQLSMAEFESVKKSVTGRDGREKRAADSFVDSLTPDEIQTLKLAQKLNLTTLKYSNPSRDSENDRYGSPIEDLTTIVSGAMQGHINKVFGRDSYEEFLDEKERASNHPSVVVDAFSRLNPRYVMERFGSNKAMNTKFIWAITEDGQLKIMPSMNLASGLPPQTARLVAGRNIYAGGTFTINHDGSVSLLYNSTNYEHQAAPGSSRQSGDRRSLEKFVVITFGIQAGRKVSEPDALTIRVAREEQRDSRYERNNRYQREDRYENSYEDNFEDFFARMAGRAGQRSSGPITVVKWELNEGDPLKSVPLARKDFRAKYPHLQDLDWALYVLRSTSEMNLDEIKKSYRKLVGLFHPDRNNQNKDAEQTTKNLNEAYEIMKNELKGATLN